MKRVTVVMDGKRISVPEFVGSWRQLRDVLGVQPGFTVGQKVTIDEIEESSLPPDKITEAWVLLGETEEDVPGQVVRVWEFIEGEEYSSLPVLPAIEFEVGGDDDLDAWESDPDAWKR